VSINFTSRATFEIVEVSTARIKVNAFPNMSKMCVPNTLMLHRQIFILCLTDYKGRNLFLIEQKIEKHKGY